MVEGIEIVEGMGVEGMMDMVEVEGMAVMVAALVGEMEGMEVGVDEMEGMEEEAVCLVTVMEEVLEMEDMEEEDTAHPRNLGDTEVVVVMEGMVVGLMLEEGMEEVVQATVGVGAMVVEGMHKDMVPVMVAGKKAEKDIDHIDESH
mmetsp:Transcript_32405/g.44943  ORF Transcript_32405/g.44943 Transcript_32405/m.44943 type:complete len:146 (+) Transcript_32405:2498-2935(+)